MASRDKQCDQEDREDMMMMGGEMQDPNMPIWVNKFTEDSARAFVKQLQFQSARDPNAPIVIYIDSYGGEVHSVFTMLAALEAVPNQIVTVAFGKAMSAGALLLMSGDLRYASQYSTVMIHEMSAGAVGHINDLEVQHRHMTALNQKLLKMMAERMKIKGGASALKKLFEKERDIFLNPEESVKLGIVDKIGVPTLQRKVSAEWGLFFPSNKMPPGAKDGKQPPARKGKV